METPGDQETVVFRNDVAESDRQKKIAESRQKSDSNNNKQLRQVASVGDRLNGWAESVRGVGECTLITALVIHVAPVSRLQYCFYVHYVARCAQRERSDSCG